ncbi:SDR family oxidoreductase [Candidatus Nitrosocosmicus arcticus]|uniref:Glucose/ribitol dehydrogenase family protein/short chain alcohol dehydrogenase n=1 Tax=Candidatus Nitrosocosmicus arcticus TaxID=2035267 RepID=A0A557SRE7_9ARCH|nr:SDR family oxidoreductase [Candidatus Nitrosocosmicus arcticus]TVP39182.1 glucose/ribitol dehydrogenase family protein/short chain alcohol dehydrogenase [Candidatus Nitrosocosmicus arcticus]
MIVVVHAWKKTTKKIALVTGASRGIGFETCKQLSQLDMTVLLTSRDTTKGEVAAKQLTDKGLDVIFFQLDASDRSNIKDIFTKIKRQYGCLDILINNAAILYDKNQSTMNADLELVNKALTTNLYGPWLLCQAFIPLMGKNGYGRVVNVSSGAASLHYMEGGTPAYGISKVALNALTRKLASELGRKNVLVNSVDPGWVATDMGGRGGRPVEEGCRGIVWAATLPNNGPSGGFFYDGEPELW